MNKKQKVTDHIRKNIGKAAIEQYKNELYVAVREGAGKDSYSDTCDYIDEYPQFFPPIHLEHVLSAMKLTGNHIDPENGTWIETQYHLDLPFDQQQPEVYEKLAEIFNLK